ncbi:serine protease [Chytridiales sp. JEL 0842]|nr:serine protease [Chytridiales sp. JEL 0842]
MRVFSMFTLALGAFAQLVVAAPTPNSANGSPIPNRYIVVFKNTTNSATVANHQAWLDTTARLGSAEAPQFRRIDGAAYPEIEAFNAFSFVHKYNSVSGFKGYAAAISPSIAESLKALPEVAFVEQDSVATIYGSQAEGAPWGLRRLSAPSLPLPTAYTYNDAAGEGVDAYIIDTGVLISHPDLEGRAKVGISFSSDGNDVDGNGHGSHVAGTVAGKTYGVAKKATIIAVKVLSASGSGTFADVIAGINWVAENAPKTGRKSVANMSLGGGATAAVDAAVEAAVKAGVTMVVAAGNNGRDACSNSPARAPSAITVAASDINDRIASFSDRGSCVDIIAPGVNVLSIWNNGATNTISGTSMASPHVAGVVAVALSTGKVSTPEEAVAYISGKGASGKIAGITATTKNILAQVEL